MMTSRLQRLQLNISWGIVVSMGLDARATTGDDPLGCAA